MTLVDAARSLFAMAHAAQVDGPIEVEIRLCSQSEAMRFKSEVAREMRTRDIPCTNSPDHFTLSGVTFRIRP